MPSRRTGKVTGSPISPRSPVVSQARLKAFPGSIATISVVAGTSVWRRSMTARFLRRRVGQTASPTAVGEAVSLTVLVSYQRKYTWGQKGDRAGEKRGQQSDSTY